MPHHESEHTLTDELAASVHRHIEALNDDTSFADLIPPRSYGPKKKIPEALRSWHDFCKDLTPDQKGQISKVLSLLAAARYTVTNPSPRELASMWGQPVSHTLGTFRGMTIKKFKYDYAIPDHLAGDETYDFLVSAGFFQK